MRWEALARNFQPAAPAAEPAASAATVSRCSAARSRALRQVVGFSLRAPPDARGDIELAIHKCGSAQDTADLQCCWGSLLLLLGASSGLITAAAICVAASPKPMAYRSLGHLMRRPMSRPSHASRSARTTARLAKYCTNGRFRVPKRTLNENESEPAGDDHVFVRRARRCTSAMDNSPSCTAPKRAVRKVWVSADAAVAERRTKRCLGAKTGIEFWHVESGAKTIICGSVAGQLLLFQLPTEAVRHSRCCRIQPPETLAALAAAASAAPPAVSTCARVSSWGAGSTNYTVSRRAPRRCCRARRRWPAYPQPTQGEPTAPHRGKLADFGGASASEMSFVVHATSIRPAAVVRCTWLRCWAA